VIRFLQKNINFNHFIMYICFCKNNDLTLQSYNATTFSWCSLVNACKMEHNFLIIKTSWNLAWEDWSIQSFGLSEGTGFITLRIFTYTYTHKYTFFFTSFRLVYKTEAGIHNLFLFQDRLNVMSWDANTLCDWLKIDT